MDVTILGGVGYDKERQQQNLKFKRKKRGCKKIKERNEKKNIRNLRRCQS